MTLTNLVGSVVESSNNGQAMTASSLSTINGALNDISLKNNAIRDKQQRQIEQLKENLNSKTKEELVHDFIEITNLYVDEVKERTKVEYEVLQLQKVIDILKI